MSSIHHTFLLKEKAKELKESIESAKSDLDREDDKIKKWRSEGNEINEKKVER